ncbi:MAG: gliding motility-associated C-terminal domain-containing protein [Bacteroidota bacterium]
MNYPQCGGRKRLLTILVILSFIPMLSATNPELVPVFLDPVPNDTSVTCFSDIPAPISLQAQLDDTDIVDVSPIDSLADGEGSICTGGDLIRIWEVSDNTGTTRVTQTISFGPASSGPSFGGLSPSPTIVECRIANDITDPNSFEAWRNNNFFIASSALEAGCVGIASLEESIVGPTEGFSCGDETIVTFTATDSCGATATVNFVFQTTDTEPPVFDQDPPDLILECSDTIPDPPVLTATDCKDEVSITFQESSTQIIDGSCAQYEYSITRVWTATDDCGNTALEEQIIRVFDTEPPTFDLAPQVTLTCTQNPNDLNLTDSVRNVMDNCSPSDQITATFTDEIIGNPQCSQIFRISRTWTVTDVCGNAAIFEQNIFVVDQEAPSFDLPEDIGVNCSDAFNLDVTGVPTNIVDVCDATPNFEFEDIILPTNCPGDFRIRRQWRIFDDCGNEDGGEQIITVIDTTPPSWTTPPSNLITTCNNTDFQEETFNLWVLDFAGAIANDACSANENITYEIFVSGTEEYPLLPDFECNFGGQMVRELAVDVVATDECGNRLVETVFFRQIDTQPPNIFGCPENQILETAPGRCDVLVGLAPPVIQESCVTGLPLQLNLVDTIMLSSPASGTTQAGDTPVDTICFRLQIEEDLPVNAFMPGQLTISLLNADTEASGEFFTILGEDGTPIGTTAFGEVQCSDSDTIIEIPRLTFNNWASDGYIDIKLIPNQPADQAGNFAINDICPDGSFAVANLFMPIRRLAPLQYEIFIDDDEPILVDPVDSLFTTLDQGVHQIRYRVTDCGGNFDECIFSIAVEDREPPMITCPEDVVAFLAPDSCRAEITLPIPVSASDNCDILIANRQTLPEPADRFLLFNFDANLNSFQAQPKTITFTNLEPIAFDTATVTIFFRGDFSGAEDFLDILDGDGNVIASSQAGQANCTQEGRIEIRIPTAEFNDLAAQTGSLTFTLRPRPVPVPPGMNGDGVEPCPNGQPVTGNDDFDAVSYVYAELNYPSLEPSYYSYGATPIDQVDGADLPVVQTFDLGTTNFTYLISDPSGNVDSCTFLVEVRDTIRPIAGCRPNTLFVDPSGLSPISPDPTLINDNSFDNCDIDSMALNPSTFTCQQYGQAIDVTLSVFDGSGNVDSCSTFLSIAPLNPEPEANSGLCGGDSLFLFANPPTEAEPGQVIYTFTWFDPQGNFFSNDENPVLVGVDASFEGNYRVVIRGLSGCEAEGVVQVTIADLPVTPVILAPEQVCIGDPIPLQIEQAVMTGNVNYRWFEGQAGSGTFLGATNDPFFEVPPPHGDQGRRFYLEVEIDGCISAPSSSILVTTTQRPEAIVVDSTVFACENTTEDLEAQISPNSTFNWTGPDGFSDTGRIIEIADLSPSDEGWYFVQAVRGGGCFSEVDSLFLTILPAPAQPNLSTSAPVCLDGSFDLMVEPTNAFNYTFFVPNGQIIATDTAVLTIDSIDLTVEGGWEVVVDFGGCPSLPSAPVDVDVSALPFISLLSFPDPVCAGNDLVLQGSSSISNSSFSWTGPNDFSSDNFAPTLSDIDLDNSGWYLLEVSSPNGCQTSDSILIEVDTGLIVTGIENLSGDCFAGGETVAVIANVEPFDSTGDYSFEWNGPQGMSMGDTLFLPDVGPGTSGNYSVIATGPDGCRSVQESFLLDLSFEPATPAAPSTISGQFDFCVGDNFTLTTTDFGDMATYLWQLPDGSIISSETNLLQLLATPPAFVGSYRVRVIIDGCSSPFSDVRIITASEFPAEMNVSAASPVCEGREIQLQVTDLPNTMYSWTGPNEFTSSLPNPLIIDADPDLHNGTYQVVATQGGCVSDTLSTLVEVMPSPDVPTALPVDAICLTGDQGLVLDVNPNTTTEGATYQWIFTDTEMPISPEGQGLSFELSNFDAFPGQGEYQISVVANLDGCLSDASLPITVRLDDSDPNAAQAMEDTTVCEGIFLLMATPPTLGQGQWSLIGGGGDVFIANPNSFTTAVDSLTEFGSPYQFLWSVSNGACTDFSQDTVQLAVTDGEDAFAGEDLLVCLNQEIRLNASPTIELGSEGSWSQNLAQEILGVVIVDPQNPNTPITGLQADNVYSFTWTVQSACGIKEDIVLVNVSDPNPDAGPDLIVCNEDGATVLAAAEPTIGSEGRWIVITDGVIIDDLNSPTTMVRNLMVGQNLLVWQVDGGECGSGSMDTLMITYKEPALPEDDVYDVGFQSSISFDPLENDLIPEGTGLTFQGEPDVGELTDNGDGTYTYQAAPNFTGEVSISYQLTSEGCSETEALVTFRVGLDANCVPPNIFTPNDDGVNDFFIIPCLLNTGQFPNSQVSIYNQWGDEVYRSPTPYQGDWDGNYQGTPLPVSTYFYVIEYGDGREAATGSVRIQR